MAPPDAAKEAVEGGPPDTSQGAGPAEHALDPASERLGYEVTDASGRSLAWVMLVGVIVIAGSIGGLFGLIAHYHREDASRLPLTAQQRASITPPGPRLQDDPFRDIAALRQREADMLNGYAYLGSDHARARIPIDRAAALVLGRSLDGTP